MKTKRGPRGPYRNSTADRIRRLHAQGVSVDDIAKRTGSSNGYVLTVTRKVQTVAQKKAQDEAARKDTEAEISEALYRAAFEKETGEPAPQKTIAEAKPVPEVSADMKHKSRYTNVDRIKRANERISTNLVLLHTYFKNPDRVYSTYRYEYISPVQMAKRTKFLGTTQNMTLAEAWKAVTRYNKIVANGKDPFPVGVKVTGWSSGKNIRDNALPITPAAPAPAAPTIVVPLAAALRDEPTVEVAEEPAFVPPFLKEEPVYRNESEFLKAKGNKQLIKPVPPEISEPVKARVKRVVKPKPLPEPNPTVWGAIKAKLRGWLA
jgi:hypothetical protein